MLGYTAHRNLLEIRYTASGVNLVTLNEIHTEAFQLSGTKMRYIRHGGLIHLDMISQETSSRLPTRCFQLKKIVASQCPRVDNIDII